MIEVGKLPNIGKILKDELNSIGIYTDEDLIKIGSINTILRMNIENINEGCCNKLYAIEGAICGIRWHLLPKEHREKIKNEYKKAIDEKAQNK